MNAVEYDFSRQGEKYFYEDIKNRRNNLLDKINSVEKGNPLRETYIDLCFKLDEAKVRYERQRKDYFESIMSLFDAGEDYEELLRIKNLNCQIYSEKKIYENREIIIEEERFLEQNYLKSYENEMKDFVEWVEEINYLDFAEQDGRA